MIACSTSCAPSMEIARVGFRVLSADEIRRMSVVEVTEATLYNRNLPAIGGVNDHRMGTVDRRVLCGTCGGDVAICQGHSGHIELAYPVYHSAFYDTVYKTLKCVCFMCSRACVDLVPASSHDHPKAAASSGKRRLLEALATSKGVRACPHCGGPRPTYARSTCAIKAEWASDTPWESDEEREYCTRPFTAREALSILQNMPDADVAALGFDPVTSHPKNMVVTALYVPPPCTRPSIVAAEGSKTRGQDDLTTKLQEIVKRSSELRTALGGERWQEADMREGDRLERLQRLQFDVFTLVNNSVRGQRPSTQRSGAPTKSLIERIKGKDGRIRGCLMGKRVNFSARSVISPGPFIGVDEVGVPIAIALLLTVPERVTAASVERLARRVRNGAGRIDGAECVITPQGALLQLAQCADRGRLYVQPGWIVERYLEDGDVVIFNRQPSLHKMGMMGHRVRLVDGLTFRLNLSVTAPYNADFDGDEMNLHVPQTTGARASVRSLMMVGSQVLAPQSNKPCVGLVQDTLLGCYLATRPRERFAQHEAAHLAFSLKHRRPMRLPPPSEATADGAPRWTGKRLFSLLLDPCVCIDHRRSGGDVAENEQVDEDEDENAPLWIERGELRSGKLDKSVLGSSAGGVIDILSRDGPPGSALRFMEDAQRFARAYLAMRGFNVGIADCTIDRESREQVGAIVAKATRLASEIAAEADESSVSSQERELAEATIRRILSKALTQTGGIVESSFSSDNALRSMVMCGSKGSMINLSQIAGCVGQQSVDGRRISAEKGSRTLSCFQFGERSLASLGFVKSSYSEALEPHEFFFHAMGGREGLVDTAVKTATTGYIQRRLIKAMESHAVHADGSVRSATGDVVQFEYAGRGLDPSLLERVKLHDLEASADELVRRFGARDGELLVRLRRRVLDALASGLGDDLGGEIGRAALPFSPRRARAQFLRRPLGSKATPAERRRAREAAEKLRAEAEGWRSATMAYAFAHECPTESVVARYSADDIERLHAHVRSRVERAAINPGEMVGCIAAQSIGEPTTQMTLNTFHFAGVSAKNVTLGIPRLQELLTLTRSIRSPSLTLRLRPPFHKSEAVAQYLASTLPTATLADVVVGFDVIYDPDPRSTLVESDRWMVEIDAELAPLAPADASMSSYVARVRLDEKAMRAMHLTPPDVRRLLRARLRDRAHVISSELNDVEWVVRVRVLHLPQMVERAGASVDREAVLTHRVVASVLSTLSLGGCPGVGSAQTRRERSCRLVDDDLETDEEIVIDTAGGRLSDVAIVPLVDWSRSQSNDVHEIHASLGIEAATRVLYDEMHSVISFDGTYVFPGHLMMVVDTMTRDGWLKALNRFGINRDSTSALSRCTFEETSDVLTEAAAFAERTPAKGVSTKIILGQPAEVGTGTVDVRFHKDMLSPSMRGELIRKAGIVKSTVRRPPVTTTTATSSKCTMSCGGRSADVTTNGGTVADSILTKGRHRHRNHHHPHLAPFDVAWSLPAAENSPLPASADAQMLPYFEGERAPQPSQEATDVCGYERAPPQKRAFRMHSPEPSSDDECN